MELIVSSIAWTNEEEPAVAEKLQELGVKYVEIAPTKKWDDPTSAPPEEIEAYKEFWKSYGISIVAFQSMLFNRLDLKLFEDETNRNATLKYLGDFTGTAGRFGAGIMVFGSPKNRQRGEMSYAGAETVAIGFFKSLGDIAASNNVTFCIEPNPTAYACDFVTTSAEGIDLVSKVNSPGFGLHLDIAGMTLAGDNIAESIHAAAPLLRHFHISSPYLEQVEDRPDVKHHEAAKALQDVGYRGYVSIEMRPGDQGQNVERVEKAVTFAQSVYSS